MNAYHEEFWKRDEASDQGTSVSVRDTNWGFAITEASDHPVLIEKVAKGLAIALAPAGIAFVLIPGIGETIRSLPTQFGITIGFFLVGLATYAYAARGFRTELQVDSARGEFRLGTMNARGLFACRQTYPTSQVESVFLARAKDRRNTAQLFLRIRGTSEKVYVLTGSERDLVPALERIAEAVRKRSRHRQSRTKTTGRFIHATFS